MVAESFKLSWVVVKSELETIRDRGLEKIITKIDPKINDKKFKKESED